MVSKRDGGTFSASTLCHFFVEDFESALPNACKFWGTWNRNAFRHPWWWGLSSKDEPHEAFREKGFVMRRTCSRRLSRARRCLDCAFGVLTTKWRLLNKAIETKPERILRYISLLHNIITYLEGTTRDHSVIRDKGKAVPLQAWSGPECSRKLRLSDFVTTAHDGGKVVSLTHRPPLSPGNIPGTHFC